MIGGRREAPPLTYLKVYSLSCTVSGNRKRLTIVYLTRLRMYCITFYVHRNNLYVTRLYVLLFVTQIKCITHSVKRNVEAVTKNMLNNFLVGMV